LKIRYYNVSILRRGISFRSGNLLTHDQLKQMLNVDDLLKYLKDMDSVEITIYVRDEDQ